MIGVSKFFEEVLKYSVGKPLGPGDLLFCNDLTASNTYSSDISFSNKFLSVVLNFDRGN